MTESDIIQHASGLNPDLALAVRAARGAGDLLQRAYGRLNVIEQKDYGDLVSEADRDADRVISEILGAESDLPILSEEIHHDLPDRDNLWIVDPLDGSSAFLMRAGTTFSSVLIAARRGGQTCAGVAHFPLTGEWFYACRGTGAWKDGVPLRITTEERPLGEVWVEMNQYGNAHWESAFFRQLRTRLRSRDGARLVTSSPPNSGVALRIASEFGTLAAAVHDNNPDQVKQAAWDIAAPQLILEEAGGIFLSPSGNRSDPFVAEPVVVARSRELGESILRLSC